MHFCVLRDAMMFGLHRRHFSHWAKKKLPSAIRDSVRGRCINLLVLEDSRINERGEKVIRISSEDDGRGKIQM
jgi:hypothetical protein